MLVVHKHGPRAGQSHPARDPRRQLRRKDPEAEARVREVFRDVGVDAAYVEYEAMSYARINALINSVPELQRPNGEAVLLRGVFRSFLEKIFKRTK